MIPILLRRNIQEQNFQGCQAGLGSVHGICDIIIVAPLFPELKRLAAEMHDPADREEIIRIVLVRGLES